MKAPEMKSGVVIPAGTYRATVKAIEEKEKRFGDEPPMPGIRFIYDVSLPDGTAVELSRHLTLSRGKKSFLRADLVSLVGEKAFEIGCESDEAFTAMMDGLIGRELLLKTEVRIGQTSGAEYTNITAVAAMPAKIQKAPAQAGRGRVTQLKPAAKVLPDGMVELGDDDIPF